MSRTRTLTAILPCNDLAAAMGRTAEDKPWGMYQFALSDPDETLVRVGWPSRL